MAELVVTVPDRVAEEFAGTVEWVQDHLDDGFGIDRAVTTAMTDWVTDIRLEFARVESDGGDPSELDRTGLLGPDAGPEGCGR